MSRKPTHGQAFRGKRTRTFITWAAMKARCQSRKPGGAHLSTYSDRGINFCPSWKDFNVYLSDMGETPEGMTLGRIDNDGWYCPFNCRWETQQQQAQNRSNTVRCVVNGVEMSRRSAARATGVDISSLRYRMDKKGESFEQAVEHLRGLAVRWK